MSNDLSKVLDTPGDHVNGKKEVMRGVEMNSDGSVTLKPGQENSEQDTMAYGSTGPEKPASDPTPTLRSVRAAAEAHAIAHALRETGWNRKRAAQLLSISYRGLLYKIRQHGIVW